MRRRAAWLAAAGAAVAATLLLAPTALVQRGHRERDAVADADLVAQVEGLDRARTWYERAEQLPLYRDQARQARLALDQRLDAAFEANRRSLAAGRAGADLHLAWLADRARLPAWSGEQARLSLLRAHVSYGRLDPGGLEVTERDGPFAQAWLGVDALCRGALGEVPPALHQAAPGLLLLGEGPAPPGAEAGSDLVRLVVAEHARRRGDPLEARRLLAPLVEADGPLAAAAAESWGLSLVDELVADPAGGMLIGTEGQVEPLAVAGLRARLLLAPDDDPAWTGAWLALAELDARRGEPEAAVEAAAAGAAAAIGAWAPPPEALPAMARLHAPVPLHPERLQQARLAVGAARLARLAAGEEAEQLAMVEAVLLLLQGRGYLVARDLPAARGRFALAAELAPASPAVTGWQVLAALLDDDREAAEAALAALPELAHTADDDALRAAAAAWLEPAAPPAGQAPAAAMRALLLAPWPPLAPLALAQAHADRPEDLALALGSPPTDGCDLDQAVAQAHLQARVAATLSWSDPAPTERRDRLRDAVLAQPLWALFPLGAFTLVGPDLPAPLPPEG